MRKIKANHSIIPDYYKFCAGKVMQSGAEYKGTFYTLDKRLTTTQKESLLNRHGNIMFFMSQAQYAPEQVHDVIFIADKNFKEAII